MGENHPLILCGVHFLFSSLTLLECLFSPLLPADQITRFIVEVVIPPTHTHTHTLTSLCLFSPFLDFGQMCIMWNEHGLLCQGKAGRPNTARNCGMAVYQ